MTVEQNIITCSYELGIQMADRGHRDKQTGRDPLPLAIFENATRSIISEESNIAQLLYENYMIGYNGEK